MNPLKVKRQRILLLFLLGVGIPSLLLGYLAFRGIQNDRALLEKENREELQDLARSVTARAEEDIAAVESEFRRVLDEGAHIANSDLNRLLKRFKAPHPLVEEIFLIQKGEGVVFPVSDMLFQERGSIKNREIFHQDSGFQEQLRSAQLAEFQEKNYRKAASLYRQLTSRIPDLSTQGSMLNALARVQKNAGLVSEAVETYKQIVEDFAQVRSSTGIPLGLAAGFELASLLIAEGDSQAAFLQYFDVYKGLVGRRWALERAEYDFFSSRTRESLEALFSAEGVKELSDFHSSDFLRLKAEETLLREKTERLLSFQANAPSEFFPFVFSKLPLLDEVRERVPLEIGGRFFLVCVLQKSGDSGFPDGSVWGFSIERDYLIGEVIGPALKQIVSSDRTAWTVKDRNGGFLLASDSIPEDAVKVQATFTGDFPDWRLELYRQDPRLVEAFLSSRRGIYFFIFLLLGGILIFGLGLTVRTVAQELELSRMKSDFVSTISHEFKSPLTSIRQLAEMLQSGRVPSEERRQKYYDVLVEQSERLTLLTENVLNFAKMEEGKKTFDFEPVDIGRLLEDAVNGFQERVRHDGFDLELSVEKNLPLVPADRTALTQAINNLLDNAIKYSGEAKKVQVNTKAEEKNIVISVRDFGLGIKKEEQGKVFERFYRGGDELTRTVKGSGLGLTLVKQIVDAHKGTVSVESGPGQGSIFVINLPLNFSKDKRHG